MNDYETKVEQQVEKLSSCSYREIEAGVAKKRVAWYQGQSFDPRGTRSLTPREAFERLFFDYMRLAPADLLVIDESPDAITWLSKNPCPTLDACLRLGLDTRKVCRAIYEKSTQAFLSQIDPQFRFLRSYQEIRPFASHCRESILKVDFERMMKLAIEEAKQSLQAGNQGYGAVVVLGQQILAKAHDTTIPESDLGLHAEVNAIREAIRVTGEANLSGAILFSTCEPCPRCSALAIGTNLTSIVYGASIEKTVQLGKARRMVGAKEMVERSPMMVEVIGDVLVQDCIDLYRKKSTVARVE